MVKPCHVVVRLGGKAIVEGKYYRVMLHKHGSTSESALYCQNSVMEMTYSNTMYKNEYYGDICGASIVLMDGASKIYFNFNNPFIGYPSARLGTNEDVEWNNGHNFAEGESYTFILDNVRYKITRFADTDNKEFLLEIDAWA